MVRAGRRIRRNYNPVAGEDDSNSNHNEAMGSNNEDPDMFVDEEAPPASETPLRGRRRRQYQTLSTGSEDDDDVDEDVDASSVAKEDDATVTEEDDDEDDDDEMNKGEKITIVILDPAQKKFQIPAYTQWTVAQFKKKGEKVHKVAPPSQRLIYRGRLLADDSTLEDLGLTSDNLIVHLFPKPRVVIQQKQGGQSSESSTCASEADGDGDDGNGGESGAHVPQIVLNPDEAEQRAHILVLGSADFLEAQNNVKLFSFLLLVISSIELFNLILILLGVPPDPAPNHNNPYSNSGDDMFDIDTNDTAVYPFYTNNNNNNNNPYIHQDPYEEEQIQEEMQTWHPRNNVDFVISALGVYVAMLGIRATNETTLRLARQYLFGTVVVGIAWMMFNYWFTVHVQEEFDELRREERHNKTHHHGHHYNHSGFSNSSSAHNGTDYDDGDDIPIKSEWEYYQQNLSLMMIPAMVWMLCCVRAWQFQSLLEEAEREAEERIRNELAQHRLNTGESNDDERGENGGGGGGGDEEEGGREDTSSTSRPRRGRGRNDATADLELQNTSAVIT